MSKQPCVWVVERNNTGWVPFRPYLSEGAANATCEASNYHQPGKFRVAKYVRVEPAKKKGQKT